MVVLGRDQVEKLQSVIVVLNRDRVEKLQKAIVVGKAIKETSFEDKWSKRRLL